jgi:hypothetical protein
LTPPPDGTLHFEGFLCGTLVDLTTDSMATITKSGNATLTCQIKQNAA